MTFGPSIQSLIGVHSGGSGIAVDWTREAVWETSNTNLSKYGLITGLEIDYLPLSSIPNAQASSLIGLAKNGDAFVTANLSGISAGGMARVAATSLAIVGGFTYSGEFGSGGFIGVTVGSAQYLVDRGPGSSIIGTLGRVLEMSATTFLAHQDFVHLSNAKVCAGPVGTGIAYIISSPPSLGTDITLSKIVFAVGFTPTNTVVGAIGPTDVDAGWTNIGIDGLCLDKTDNKILAVVFKSYGSTGSASAYLIKINPVTATVEWKAPLPAGSAGGGDIDVGNTFQFSDIRNQKVGIFTGGPNKVTIINTSDGSQNAQYTAGLAGVGLEHGQCYSDTLGAIVLNCTFTETTGSPTRLNATPTSWGSTSWAVLYVAPAILPPGPPPPIPGSDTVSPYVPPIIIPPVRQLRLFPRLPINSYRCGADGVSAFPITFRISSQADLRVSVDGVELTQADFTFTGKTSSGTWYDGGLLLLDTAAVDCMVHIWADPIPSRTTDYTEGEFSKPEANASLEQLWIVDRAQHLKQTRDTEIPLTGTVTLPAATGGLRYRLQGPITATCAGSDEIYIAASHGTVLACTDENTICEIVCVKTGLWFVRTKFGPWVLALALVLAGDYRVTQAGDTRVTMAGDTRELLP